VKKSSIGKQKRLRGAGILRSQKSSRLAPPDTPIRKRDVVVQEKITRLLSNKNRLLLCRNPIKVKASEVGFIGTFKKMESTTEQQN